MDDDQLETRLAAARPTPPTESRAILAALDELNAAVAFEASCKNGRRRRKRRRQAVTIMTLVCVSFTATAAAAVTVYTGWFTGSSSEHHAGEWLDTGVSGYADVVSSLEPGYVSYPVPLTSENAAEWVAASTGRSGGLVQEISIVRGFETYSLCSWGKAWNTSSDDGSLRAEATERIEEAVGWPAFTATDGGGIVDALGVLAAGARDGREDVVTEQSSIICPVELLEQP